MTKTTRVYRIGTNGLAGGQSGKCDYMATDPDEALMFAYRHERFLRLLRNYPNINPARAMQLAKDELAMPDFRVKSCVLHEGD